MAKSKVIIAGDSCCDLTKEIRQEYNIEYYRMGVIINGETTKYATLDFEEDQYSFKGLYDLMRQGNKMKTNQVIADEYFEKSRKWLKEGYDIVYIACSSALSGSINTFNTIVAPKLREEFPGRTIIGIDSLNAAVGQGFMCVHAAKLRDEGKSAEEIAKYIEDNKLRYNFYATVATLTYLKNAGRIKGAKAFFGNLFHKRPVFLSDRYGNNTVIKTVTGTKNSLNELIEQAKATIENSEDTTCFVGHGDDPETAEILKERLLKETKCKKVIMSIVGPITGVTCGPGALVIGCFGRETPEYATK